MSLPVLLEALYPLTAKHHDNLVFILTIFKKEIFKKVKIAAEKILKQGNQNEIQQDEKKII